MTDQLVVHWENAANATLDQLVYNIRIVWAAKDARRTIYDTLLHTVHHASKLGEQVRRGEYQGVLDELGDTVMWFLTFVGKLRQPIKQRQKTSREQALFYTPLSLTDIVWNKYPYTCHTCYYRLSKEGKEDLAWKRKCDCLMSPSVVEERSEEEKLATALALKQSARDHRGEKVSTLAGLEEMFAHIYEANYENLSLESIAFHLLEEVGEISDALIRLYSYDLGRTHDPSEAYRNRTLNLEGEIADTVSWIFAVSLKLKRLYQIYDKLPSGVGPGPFQAVYIPRAPQINFVNILWNRYGDRNTGFLHCPACSRSRCICRLRFYKTEKGIKSLIGKYQATLG